MKKIVISVVFVVLFVGFANAQTQSVTGNVTEENTGASGRYAILTIVSGGKQYDFYTFSASGEKSLNPKVIGDVGIGKTVRVYYSHIEREGNGYSLTATKVVAVKRSKSRKK